MTPFRDGCWQKLNWISKNARDIQRGGTTESLHQVKHEQDKKQSLVPKKYHKKKSMHYLEEKQSTFYEDVDQVEKLCSEEPYSLFTIRGNKEEPIYVTMEVCQIPVEMEVDTGASVSVIGAQTYSKLSKSVSHPLVLEKSNAALKTYTGQLIPVEGILKVDLKYNNKVYKDMSLTVIEGNGPSLIGRNWLHSIRLD